MPVGMAGDVIFENDRAAVRLKLAIRNGGVLELDHRAQSDRCDRAVRIGDAAGVVAANVLERDGRVKLLASIVPAFSMPPGPFSACVNVTVP